MGLKSAASTRGPLLAEAFSAHALRGIRHEVERLIQKLPLPDERQRNVFRQYFEAFDVLFSRSAPRTVLEIGSGFSTYLLAKIAASNGARITTIDLDLGRNFKQLVEECQESGLREQVRFVRGLTLRQSELADFYRSGEIGRFGDLDMGRIASHVDDYFLIAGDDRKYKKLLDHYRLNDSIVGLKNHIFRDNLFHADPFLLEIFGFESESGFVRENERLYPIFEEEILKQPGYDAIFFDSGEFSSNIEFLKLKDKIRRGGYAIFHDITFPKSVKNFLACAYVRAKPEQWEIIYLDNKTTPQGIMVAQRR